MNYKETIFFIGKCLTINHEEHNKIIVEEQLKSGTVDWDNVVRVSTAQCVFPALYCNLKRADFLYYLPSDLVEYMKYITDLNRERNKEIIKQAIEINKILKENNITPIFIKGTAHIIGDLYKDIAERMIGDIDFWVDFKDYERSIEIFKKNNYKIVNNDSEYLSHEIHYPKMNTDNRIASIEIHKEILIRPFHKEYNYQNIEKVTHNGFTFLNSYYKLILAILSFQINDYAFTYKNTSLKNHYDTFLLSKKISVREIYEKENKLLKKINNFLCLSSILLNKPKSIYSRESTSSIKFKKKFFYLLDNLEYAKSRYRKLYKIKAIKKRCFIFIRSFYLKEYFNYSKKRIFDKEWYKQKYQQLFSKPNS